jgi:lincosamide nucleotidyltransferase A/C/D/E
MRGEDVIEVLEALERHDIHVWIDGGWGVDALVGEQTRNRLDLDLAVDQRDLQRIKQVLGDLGFRHDRTADPGLPARLVLHDDRTREIDLHPLLFDDDGHGWQQLSESGRAWGRYPAEHLQATGTITGHEVRCLTPELQARFRMGYEWSVRDEHDLKLLASNFETPLPPAFWASEIGRTKRAKK